VRAIRSYVGANSGPLTQRTNVFYPDRHEIITDLRVHPVGGPLIYHDLSAAGLGMTYVNSVNPTGAIVDGAPDVLANEAPQWHLWTGPQGSLVSTETVAGDFAAELMASGSGWYLDDENVSPAVQRQCWGDDHAFGQAGLHSTYSMPNTDPRSQPFADLRATTTDVMAGPGITQATVQALAAGIDAPLQATVR
jgi:hypothetical protein